MILCRKVPDPDQFGKYSGVQLQKIEVCSWELVD